MNRIEHYATYLKGGAGQAARRIFDGILGEVESSARSETSNSNSTWQLELLCRDDQPLFGSHTNHFNPSQSFFAKTWTRKWNRKSFVQASKHYLQHLEHRPAEFEVFSPARLYEPTARQSRLPADLIHLHWVAYLLDYQTFFDSIPTQTPIVWTLHDMNAFTGGCHYSAGCEKYKTGCGHCVQLANPDADDLSAVAHAQKQRAFSKRNLTIVTPCQWLTNLAKESNMFSASTRFETIHYGLDTQVYQPINKKKAKQELGLAPNKTTLLFGAADLTVKRKGIEPMIEALKCLPNPESYQCVIFGGGDLAETNLSELSAELEVKEIGFLDNADQQRLAYSAANMFLLPSLEDNQPQTGLESLACGTPVVAFDAGGISEFVLHGKTGLLAEVNDSENLAKQIRWLAESKESQVSFGQNGRRLILDQFEVRQQTRKYMRLYRQLMEQGSRSLLKAG